MSQRFRVAALQPALRWQQPMPNMFAIREAVARLPAATDVVVLPEMWTGLPHGVQIERTGRDATQFLQTLARTRGINVVGGSFECRGDHDEVQNVTLVVNRGGDIVGRYAKRTLFAKEQDAHRPGSSPRVLEVDGVRIAVLICADLWDPQLTRELIGRADVVCVPAKTAVPSDQYVEYARILWHGLALIRAMENGLPIAVSDWASGRHTPKEVDVSVGSPHAPGMEYDPGVLHKRHRSSQPDGDRGALEPTATAHSSAAPALGGGVHFTTGATTICNPAHRPDINRIQALLSRGEPGFLDQEIDLDAVHQYCAYRRSVGLLPPADAAPPEA